MEKSKRSNEAQYTLFNVAPNEFILSPALCTKLVLFLGAKPKRGLEQVKIIYDLADKVTSEMGGVCRKGCAHCCSIKVDVTPIEALYIEKNTKRKIIKNNSSPKYCPLLNKNDATCSVYNYRPFNCRSFLVFNSPDYCRDKQPQFNTGGPAAGYSNNALFMLGYCMLAAQSKKIKSDKDNYGLISESHEKLRRLARSLVKDVRYCFKG